MLPPIVHPTVGMVIEHTIRFKPISYLFACGTCQALKGLPKLQLVAYRDSVRGHERNRGLDQAGARDGVPVRSPDPVSAALVEAERAEVVVDHEKADLGQVLLDRFPFGRIHKGRSDPLALPEAR